MSYAYKLPQTTAHSQTTFINTVCLCSYKQEQVTETGWVIRTQAGDVWPKFQPLLWVVAIYFFLIKVGYQGKG